MKNFLMCIIFIISLSACADGVTNDGGCTMGYDLCISMHADEPIQYGESITVTITVTSTINIAGLGIYLYSSPPLLMEDINGWVDNGINWVIDITANQPQSFNRHISLPEKDGFYQILSSADTPQLHTVYSFYIHQLNGNSVVYYPNTPIPITPGVLSTTDPNTLATLYAMPSSTPWPTLIPRPTATDEVTSTPYPPPELPPPDAPYP